MHTGAPLFHRVEVYISPLEDTTSIIIVMTGMMWVCTAKCIK